MSLYPICQEVLPATAVHHCATGSFTNANDTNLIVVKGNLLEVYTVSKHDLEGVPPQRLQPRDGSEFAYTYQSDEAGLDAEPTGDAFGQRDMDSSEFHTLSALTGGTGAGTPRLRLVWSTALQGEVTSLCLVRTLATERHGRLSLLAGFTEAKMALLEYAPTCHRLVTVSLHYYERDEFRADYLESAWPPRVVTDPTHRCAVLQIYRDRLAVLPLRQADALGAFEPATAPHAAVSLDEDDPAQKRGLEENPASFDHAQGHPRAQWPYFPSFVLDLATLDPPIRNVIDIAFLHGYYEPTLAVLYEAPNVTWTGNLKTRRDTCAVVVLSLDLTNKTAPAINHHRNLPYDCFRLVAAPAPTGGVMVIAANAVIHLDQGSAGVGVSVNPMGLMAPYTAFPLTRAVIEDATAAATTEPLALERSQAVFLDPETLLLTLCDGRLVLVRCLSHGRSVSDLRLVIVGRSAVSACVARLNADLLFLGSAVGDSLLIRFQVPPKGSAHQFNYDITDKTAKGHDGAKSSPQESAVKPEADANDDDWDDDLYAPSGGNSQSGPHPAIAALANPFANTKWYAHYRFRVCDTLCGLGPVTCASVGAAGTDDAVTLDRRLELVLGTGSERSGGLSVLQRAVRPRLLTSFALPGFDRLWTVRLRDLTAPALYTTSNLDYGAELDDTYDRYLFLSRPSSTIILTASESLTQLDRTGAFTDGPTLGATPWAGATLVLQVYPGGVRLLDADLQAVHELQLQDFTRSPTTTVTSCSLVDPYALLHLDDASVAVVTWDAAARRLRFLPLPAAFARMVASAACLFGDTYNCLQYLRDLVPPNFDITRTFGLEDAAVVNPIITTMGVDIAQPATATPTAPPLTLRPRDDEDEIDYDSMDEDPLYSPTVPTPTTAAVPNGPSRGGEDVNEFNVSNLQNTVSAASATRCWCFVVTRVGTLEIYALPGLQRVFSAPDFAQRPGVVADDALAAAFAAAPSADSSGDPTAAATSPINLLSAHAFGPTAADVYLCAVDAAHNATMYHGLSYTASEEDPLETVPFLNVANSRHAALVARSVPGLSDPQTAPADSDRRPRLDERAVLARLALRFVKCPVPALQYAHDDHPGATLPDRAPAAVTAFHNLQTYRGFFITGPRPVVAFVAPTNAHPYLHPVRLDQAALAEVETASGSDGAGTGPKPDRPASPGTANEPAEATGGNEEASAAVVDEAPQSDVAPTDIATAPFATGLTGFAPFHNPQCPHGFVLLDTAGRFHIGQLDPAFRYDFAWPLRHVPLGRTVHHLTYHPGLAQYCVATSRPVPFDLPGENEDDDMKIAEAIGAAAHRPGGAPLPLSPPRPSATEPPAPRPADVSTQGMPPLVNRYRLELISPLTWEVVDSYDMEPHDSVMDLKCLALKSRETVSGRKFYVTAGTCTVASEDRAAKGKVYVLDIIEVVPEPGRPQTGFKLKYVCHEKVSGPVTAVASVNGYLVVPAGPRVFAKELKDGRTLQSIAFIDLLLYVTSATAFKNFLVMGDVSKGASFVGFQDGPAELTMLGRDYLPMTSVCGDFLVDDRASYFVVADAERNLHFLSYSPRHIQSFAGRKLLRRADFHLGCQVVAIQRLPGRAALTQLPATVISSGTAGGKPGAKNALTTKLPQKQSCLCFTETGAVYAVSTVPEKASKRLQRLYLHLVGTVPHVGGLNPRAYRLVPQAQRNNVNPSKGVVDATFLRQNLEQLPLVRRREMSHQVGTTFERVERDLAVVSQDIAYF
ncbi:mRNA cleavage and polyadenylation factor subunit [Tieghemiomyces parasiticus]|uniref:mRNA cleavage and polyadenylation factor subunit n=1 Tax=Tieghemiomyces parasiticus TaxID=78921 RepID=A0A9W8ABZ3_9FUNG|nr:mRNA cleavage and polyadenylation factor subunit [Tieghemiomyces parasiticus]